MLVLQVFGSMCLVGNRGMIVQDCDLHDYVQFMESSDSVVMSLITWHMQCHANESHACRVGLCQAPEQLVPFKCKYFLHNYMDHMTSPLLEESL